MSKIQVLDESTINQIAAGEVVERPSAVIKELIENAMDAGATAITAEIKDGGLSLIRVTDNGSGIPKEDIPLAFLRHATSKIRSAQDLLSVTSLGFRGEALSSIAAVAQVELITKPPEALLGYRYIIEGGDEKSLEEIGCPSGTTILVRNMFYNTPARRKFLKSAVTEGNYVSDLMERLIVSHPDISFKFIMNHQVKLQSSGNNNSKDILYHVYGRDISKELIPVEYHSEGFSITGYIGKPLINRGNRNHENYYINGRYIKSSLIIRAIEDAYKPFLMQHKYPFTSLYYQIDPADIDVNVHPQKLEVRLKNGEEVYQKTYQMIRAALSGQELIPSISLMKEDKPKEKLRALPEPFEWNRRTHSGNQAEALEIISQSLKESGTSGEIPKPLFVRENQEAASMTQKTPEVKESGSAAKDLTAAVTTREDIIPSFLKDTTSSALNPVLYKEGTKSTEELNRESQISIIHQENAGAKQMTLFEESPQDSSPFLTKKAQDQHRIIGQVFSTYWLIEYGKELYIIDQHAAHEKVLYEKIVAGAKEKSYESQLILPPMVISLTLSEQEVLKQYKDILVRIGYEFEHFGGNEFSVRAVPANLYGLSEKRLLMEFLDSLSEDSLGQLKDTDSILEKIASMSCKAAVKANHVLSMEEAHALITELLTLDNPYHCPHGRPVIVSMSRYELERKFKRIL